MGLIAHHSYKPQPALKERQMCKGHGHWSVTLDPSYHLAYLGFNLSFPVTNGVAHVVIYFQLCFFTEVSFEISCLFFYWFVCFPIIEF